MSPRSKEQFQEMRQRSREAILNAALELFAARGFHGATIQEIATAAEVSKGLIYNYFPSKKALLHELLQRWMEQLEHLRREVSKHESPEARLRAMLSISLALLEEHEYQWRLLTALMLQPHVFEEVRTQVRAVYEEFLEELKRDLKSRDQGSGEEEALFLGAVLDGIIYHRMLMGPDYPLAKMRAFIFKTYGLEENP